ncbi:MAG: 2OG-Fe(II) oxygenase [Candidatus Caenarcaniphilales bacterium]|nr:2OG-Fe(II) oxygenase [Candidatus Caenarcaniphilales bacterium]
MSTINLEKIKQAKLVTSPFRYFVCDDSIDTKYQSIINEHFPKSQIPGSVPMSNLEYGAAFQRLVADLEGTEFTEIIEEKLGINLSDKPTMLTVRNYCRKKDGAIHTDSKTKIITVLLYLNNDWSSTEGGCLRLLPSGESLENYFCEIEPKWGTMLVFVNSPEAWHGHKSYEGERRVLQLNWVTSLDVVKHEQKRHNFSFGIKKLLNPSHE